MTMSLEKKELRFLLDEFSRIYRKKLRLESEIVSVTADYEKIQARLLSA